MKNTFVLWSRRFQIETEVDMIFFKALLFLFLCIFCVGSARADIAKKALAPDTTEADIKFFRQYEPTTQEGIDFKKEHEGKLEGEERKRVARVGRMLRLSLTKTKDLAPPKDRRLVERVAPEIVELWARKFSQGGPDAEKFLESILKGKLGDLDLVTGLRCTEAALLKDYLPPELEQCFLGKIVD